MCVSLTRCPRSLPPYCQSKSRGLGRISAGLNTLWSCISKGT